MGHLVQKSLSGHPAAAALEKLISPLDGKRLGSEQHRKNCRNKVQTDDNKNNTSV
jgi:hypothetical protein